MKILDQNPPVNMASYRNSITNKKNIDQRADKNSSNLVKEDKVALSNRARQIQDIKKNMKSIPDIREEKVAMIKDQIEKGTYKIDGKKIAEKMIHNALLNDRLK